MVIEAIGRRLRLAVIGGGPGSVIGEVHRIAARLDGYYDIVASALSSDPERSRQSGHAIGVPAKLTTNKHQDTHMKHRNPDHSHGGLTRRQVLGLATLTGAGLAAA
jgi:hypothetical protein